MITKNTGSEYKKSDACDILLGQKDDKGYFFL